MVTNPEFDFNYNILEWLKTINELSLDHFILSEPIKISFQLSDEQFKTVQKTLEMYGETIVGKSKALRMISSTNLWRRPVIGKSMKLPESATIDRIGSKLIFGGGIGGFFDPPSPAGRITTYAVTPNVRTQNIAQVRTQYARRMSNVGYVPPDSFDFSTGSAFRR